MRTGFSPLRWALGVLVVASAVTGCSGGDPGPAPAPTGGGEQDSTTALVACMQDRGWDARYDESDGSMVVQDVPEEQQDQYLLDSEDCQAETGFGADPADLTDEQLEELYAHEVATAQCLRDEGVDVPEPSSEQAFKDAYASGSAFSAYAAVGDVPQEEWDRLNSACPQLPEGW